jgi:hypothetical protein
VEKEMREREGENDSTRSRFYRYASMKRST